MTYDDYRAKVIAEMERRLDGKPNFPVDELLIDDSFSKRHHYTVPAKVMIQDARRAAEDRAFLERFGVPRPGLKEGL